jgi:MacB-like periplasmic core domain
MYSPSSAQTQQFRAASGSRCARYGDRRASQSPSFCCLAGHWSDHCGFFSGGCDLLKPVPYPEPNSVVLPWNIPPAGVSIGGFDKFSWSPIHFHAFEQETQTFRWLGAFQGANFNLTDADDPAMLEGAHVSWGFFPALGISPALGRTFTREEDTPGKECEAVLGDALWRSRFHADPTILNRVIHLDGTAYTVIGIMPRGFDFPRANEMPGDFIFASKTQLWVPIALPAVTPRFTSSELAIVGRLQPGVSVAQAQDAMDLFAQRMDREHPEMKGWSQSLVTPLQHQVAGDTGRPLLLILSAVGAVLLVVCFQCRRPSPYALNCTRTGVHTPGRTWSGARACSTPGAY